MSREPPWLPRVGGGPPGARRLTARSGPVASEQVRHAAAPLVLTGAWGFALSDIAVARQQFVKPARSNGLWGTPLYFLSQMLIAASIGWS